MHESNDPIRVLAHRGAPLAGRAENSVDAVTDALRQGADGVEIDVRLTADDVLVCSHEAALPRYAGVRRDIATSASGALRGRLATLEQVLAAVQRPEGSAIVVEAKPVTGIPDVVRTACTLADVLAAGAGCADVTVSSFDPSLLAVIRATCADLPVRTALLGDKADDAAAVVRRARADGHDEVHLPLVSLRRAPQAAELAGSLGLDVAVWTVNDPADLRWVAGLGTGAVITDDVRGALRVLTPAGLATGWTMAG
jgi:glycerophosphoryl diester phosphodiesterase